MYYDLFLVDFEINSTAEHKRFKKNSFGYSKRKR